MSIISIEHPIDKLQRIDGWLLHGCYPLQLLQSPVLRILPRANIDAEQNAVRG